MRQAIAAVAFWPAVALHIGVILHSELARPKAAYVRRQLGPIGYVTTRVTLSLPRRCWHTPTHALLLCWTSLAIAGLLVLCADVVSLIAAVLWVAVAGNYFHSLIRRAA